MHFTLATAEYLAKKKLQNPSGYPKRFIFQGCTLRSHRGMPALTWTSTACDGGEAETFEIWNDPVTYLPFNQ